MSFIQQFKDQFHQQHYRGFVLAVIVLAALALTVVHHLQPRNASCELFRGNLKSSDLERIELALGNAGLNDFEFKNGKLFVPKSQRATYLQAVSNYGAVPSRLREQVADTDSMSMFMSRSQQKMIAQEKKKQHVREMVMRLPFVDQVWFEMDVAESASAFQVAQQTAVISIEPSSNVILDATQINTVKRMIQGAIAGIQADQIQVVDIQSGYAHHNGSSDKITRGVQGLPALEQQNYFENRIRRALDGMNGVDVNVKVDVVEIPAPNVSPVKPTVTQIASVETPRPMTNGFASIYQPKEKQPVATQVTYQRPLPTYATQVAVDVAVPRKLIENWAQESYNANGVKRSANLQAAFVEVQNEIVNRIEPLLPARSLSAGGQAPINVRLIQPQLASPLVWEDQIRPFVLTYWPSLVVLGVGAVLIASMKQSDRRRQQRIEQEEAENDGADILTLNSGLRDIVAADSDSHTTEDEQAARREAEIKLNQMIEKHPGDARKVIENWIKDAA